MAKLLLSGKKKKGSLAAASLCPPPVKNKAHAGEAARLSCLGFFAGLLVAVNCLQLKERKRENEARRSWGKRCKHPKLPGRVKVEARRQKLSPAPP